MFPWTALGVTLLLLAVLAAPAGAGESLPVDLGQIGHLGPKGRVQDHEYNPNNVVVRDLIAVGPDVIPLLVAKITDETSVKGPVLDFWPVVRVGDIALVVLCDLFTKSDWVHSTVPGLTWSELLEQGDSELPAWDVLDQFVRKHGRSGLKKKLQVLLKPYEGRIVWDDSERCFRPTSITPPN